MAIPEQERDRFCRVLHEQRTSLNDGYVRMTVYVRNDIMAGMKSLCPRQGQLKQRVNEALEEYIVKKAREMGVE